MNAGTLQITVQTTGVQAAQSQLRTLQKTVAQTATAGASMGSGWAGALGGIALGAGLAAAALYKVGEAGVKSALPIDSYKRGIAALSNDVFEYEKQIRRLTEIAKLPGLGLEESFRGGLQLMGSGIKAQTSADMVKELGNAIALVGRGKGDFKLAVEQMAKMAALGKFTTEDMNQISAYAPTVRAAFKEAMGSLDPEKVKKSGMDMQTVFERVVNVLKQGPRAAMSFQTAIDNLGDAYQIAMEPLGAGILSNLNVQTQSITFMFQELQRVNEELGTMAARLSAFSGPIQIAFGDFAVNLIKGFESAVVKTGASIAWWIDVLNTVVGKDKMPSLDDYIAYITTMNTAADMVYKASRNYAVTGKAPDRPMPPEMEAKEKKSNNHLRQISANTRRTADALEFNRQIFGGRQLGRLGVTATEIGQSNTKFRGSGQIPGSTLINRGIQQIINQSQRSYNNSPLPRY